MKIKHTLLTIAVIALCGCHNTGVVQLSKDTYFISRSSAAGMFVNMPKLKAEVIQEASRFAIKEGKKIEPISLSDTFPAHGFPSVDYQFRLVDMATNVAPGNPHP